MSTGIFENSLVITIMDVEAHMSVITSHLWKCLASLEESDDVQNNVLQQELYEDAKVLLRNVEGTKVWICIIALIVKVALRLGQVAAAYGTAILLGGFVTGLSPLDFWVISALNFINAVRLFGNNYYPKILPSIVGFRGVLVSYLVGILYYATAMVSLVYSSLRLSRNNFGDSASPNQPAATTLFYGMVLAEAVLYFANSFVGFPLLRHVAAAVESGASLASMVWTRGAFATITGYYSEVGLRSQQNPIRTMNMSLRTYARDRLQECAPHHETGIVMLLDQLYWRGQKMLVLSTEDIEERKKLLVHILGYISRHMSMHRETGPVLAPAISLACSLVVNRITCDRFPGFSWDGENDDDDGMLKAYLPACGGQILASAVDEHPMALPLLSELPGLRENMAKYLLLCLRCRDARERRFALDVLLKFSKHLGPAGFFGGQVGEGICERLLELCSCQWTNEEQQVMSSGIAALTLCNFGGGAQPLVSRVVAAVVQMINQDDVSEGIRELVLDFNLGGYLGQDQKDILQVAGHLARHQFTWAPQRWLLLWIPTMSRPVLEQQLSTMEPQDKQRFVTFVHRWQDESDATINFCASLSWWMPN